MHIDDVAPLLKHDDPLIRANAVTALRSIPVTLAAPYLVAALEDPSRNVRMAAARTVVTIPPDTAPAALRPAYGPAARAMLAFLQNQLDFPEAHLQIAGIALTQRDFASAETTTRLGFRAQRDFTSDTFKPDSEPYEQAVRVQLSASVAF